MMDPSLREKVDDRHRRRRSRARAARARGARGSASNGKVIFTGVIPHRDVVYFLKASDIFAATNELTNMSLPPCEAILCGVPVVAFDVSGTAEVVRDGETGLLVTNGDVAGFARKLETLVRDDALRKRLGAQAAAFARGLFRFVGRTDRDGDRGARAPRPPG